MPPERVIREGAVHDDAWSFLTAEQACGALPDGPIVVPLAAWKARRPELLRRRGPLGVWLLPADDPEDLGADVDALALIGVQFPKFTDGRGYSTAVLLRTRLRYAGELRAFGDVGRDQVFNLKRCGFDSFSLGSQRDPHAALGGLGDFSLRYQGSADDPRPLFRKRLDHGARR